MNICACARIHADVHSASIQHGHGYSGAMLAHQIGTFFNQSVFRLMSHVHNTRKHCTKLQPSCRRLMVRQRYISVQFSCHIRQIHCCKLAGFGTKPGAGCSLQTHTCQNCSRLAEGHPKGIAAAGGIIHWDLTKFVQATVLSYKGAACLLCLSSFSSCITLVNLLRLSPFFQPDDDVAPSLHF